MDKRMPYYAEAHSIAAEQYPIAQRALGPTHGVTIKLAIQLATSSMFLHVSSVPHLTETAALLEQHLKTMRRVYGEAHPDTFAISQVLKLVRERIASFRARPAAPTPAPADAPVRGASTPAFTFGDAARAPPPPGSVPNFGAAARASTFSFDNQSTYEKF